MGSEMCIRDSDTTIVVPPGASVTRQGQGGVVIDLLSKESHER